MGSEWERLVSEEVRLGLDIKKLPMGSEWVRLMSEVVRYGAKLYFKNSGFGWLLNIIFFGVL